VDAASFHGTDKPASTTPTLDMLATGAVVHISLSIAFGIVFALRAGAFAPLLRNWLVLGAAGVVYGLALYVVNFQILGNTLFRRVPTRGSRCSSTPPSD
jgi:uncharacterized membrane protein YagU involved in acid resistance